MVLQFLDPKNNFVFYQIFGTEKNKDILIHFLNDILNLKDATKISDVTFLPTIQNPEIAVYRQSIVDVLCYDQRGIQFIVEMQVSNHKGFEKRAQFYASKAYSRQILMEDENHKKLAVYVKLQGVIFLAIADFIMFPDKENWHSTHKILDIKTYENDLKDFCFMFLELPKFHKKLNQLISIQEKWAYFFKMAHKSSLEEIRHLIGKDLIMQRAFEAIDQASWTPKQLHTYEKLEKAKLDIIAVEQQMIEDAEARGLLRGEVKGKIEGKIEVARKMLSKNITINEISEITGLTIDELRKIF